MTKTETSPRDEALEKALAQIEKSYGKGSVMRLGDRALEAVPVIPTGIASLDKALGVGGIPRGRIIELYGHESGGKSSLATQITAQAQRLGDTVAYIDAEHALDPEHARRLGVDVDNLLICQPDYGEQALEITDNLVRSGAVGLIVIDSVAALVPKAEIDGEMGDSFVGLQARLMSQALRKLAGNIARTHTCCIFINQIREKVGVMYGSPEVTPGGRALKFWASVRIDVRRAETLKEGAVPVGIKIRAKIVKNKVAPPFREAEFDLRFSEGFDAIGSLLDAAIAAGVVTKGGSWYSFAGAQLGQGRDNARDFLMEHPEVTAAIEEGLAAG